MNPPQDLLALFVAFYLLMIPAIHFGNMEEHFSVTQTELFLTMSLFVYGPILLFILALGRMRQ